MCAVEDSLGLLPLMKGNKNLKTIGSQIGATRYSCGRKGEERMEAEGLQHLCNAGSSLKVYDLDRLMRDQLSLSKSFHILAQMSVPD